MVAPASNPNICEDVNGESELGASLGYIVSPILKQLKKKKQTGGEFSSEARGKMEGVFERQKVQGMRQDLVLVPANEYWIWCQEKYMLNKYIPQEAG